MTYGYCVPHLQGSCRPHPPPDPAGTEGRRAVRRRDRVLVRDVCSLGFATSRHLEGGRPDRRASRGQPHPLPADARGARERSWRLPERGLPHTVALAPEKAEGDMKVAITGGTGFVGRHLARALTAAGHDVVLLARGIDRRDPEAIALPRSEFFATDLSDP